ncbi:MAG: hypothetical protein ACOC1X_02990 [Promethearchaeota archaeon]
MKQELYFEEHSEQINIYRVKETSKSYKSDDYIFIGCIYEGEFSPDHTRGRDFRLTLSEMEQISEKLKEVKEDE